MVLIGLVGNKSAGKDTFADYCCSKTKCIKYAFAAPLKKACQTLFLLTDQQLYDPVEKEQIDPRWQMSPRQMFQFIGTDVMREQIHSDFWLQHFLHWYESHKEEHIIVSDVRFQNEIDLLKQCGGIIIKINRNKTSDNHISEAGIESLLRIDHVIDNTTTLENYYEQIDQKCMRLFASSLFEFKNVVDRTIR